MDFNLLKDPRTNWKFIWIVVILGILAGAGILGYYQWWLEKQEAKFAELPEIKLAEKVIKDGTTDWQSYEGKLIKVQFKVPPSWEIEEKDGSIFEGKKVNTMIITRNPAKSRGFTITENPSGGFAGLYEIESLEEEVVVDGTKTSKIYFKFGEWWLVKDPSEIPDQPITMWITIMDVNGNNYRISGSWEADDYEETDKIIDQILSTFKFIE